MKRKDSLPTVWPLEPHTAAKHEILRRYLDGWFPILGRWNGRVVFLDGFAGPGIYRDGEPGSPIIALNALLEHPRLPNLECEFVFAYMEPDEPRYRSLTAEIERLKAAGLPGNVKIDAVQATFEAAAGDILGQLEAQKKALAPTFAFIDPFGFTGIPIELICRLLSFERCDVLINFMIGFVNRFVEHPDQQENFQYLFGTDAFKEAAALQGRERLEYLLSLYQSQLRNLCGFRYTQSFEMINDRGHTGNALIYGTRSLEGLRVMKDAMWKVDPAGGVRFSDRFAGQEILFAGDQLDLAPLRDDLLNRFAGRSVRIEDVREYVLAQTPYADGHWNRPIMTPLERAGDVTVVRSPRKRNFGFPPGTVVRFR